VVTVLVNAVTFGQYCTKSAALVRYSAGQTLSNMLSQNIIAPQAGVGVQPCAAHLSASSSGCISWHNNWNNL